MSSSDFKLTRRWDFEGLPGVILYFNEFSGVLGNVLFALQLRWRSSSFRSLRFVMERLGWALHNRVIPLITARGALDLHTITPTQETIHEFCYAFSTLLGLAETLQLTWCIISVQTRLVEYKFTWKQTLQLEVLVTLISKDMHSVCSVSSTWQVRKENTLFSVQDLRKRLKMVR